MKCSWLMLASCLVLVLTEIVPATQAGPYVDDDDNYPPGDEDYSDNAIDRLLQSAQKRACVRRGVTVTTGPTIVATTVPAGATYGARIADVNEWACSRSGVKCATQM